MIVNLRVAATLMGFYVCVDNGSKEYIGACQNATDVIGSVPMFRVV